MKDGAGQREDDEGRDIEGLISQEKLLSVSTSL